MTDSALFDALSSNSTPEHVKITLKEDRLDVWEELAPLLTTNTSVESLDLSCAVEVLDLVVLILRRLLPYFVRGQALTENICS